MQVHFTPVLLEQNIREKALRLAISNAVEGEKARQEGEVTSSADAKKKTGKRRKSLVATATASPLVSSKASVAASGCGSQGTGNQISEGDESRDHAEIVTPRPEKGWVGQLLVVYTLSYQYFHVSTPCIHSSEMWVQAYQSLITSYTNECLEFDIPCFVSDTVPGDERIPPTYQ